MITKPGNIQAMLKDLTQNGIFWVTNAGAPTDGTSGTGVDVCGPGSLLWDSTNKKLYVNTNTKASPTWKVATIEAVTGDVTVSAAGVSAIGAGKVLSAMMEEGLVRRVEVSLTNANVLNLRATPIEIVAAPGAGKVAIPLIGGLFFDYTAAYTESTDNFALKYTNGSGVQCSETIETTGFVDATADTATSIIGKKDNIVAKTGCDNQAIVLHNIGDGELGGGNAANVIRVRLVYTIQAAGW